MNDITRKIASIEWKYAPQDRAAQTEMSRRLIETARRESLISYSDLVSGFTFHLETVNDAEPFEIDTHSWSELDRAILGDFLGCIAAESYIAGGFLLSAVAVGKAEGKPTRPFFTWAKDLGLLTDDSDGGRTEFWSGQVIRAFAAHAGGK